MVARLSECSILMALFSKGSKYYKTSLSHTLQRLYARLPIIFVGLAVGALRDGVAIAQIVADPSLGPENSLINAEPNANAGATYTITGGATRDTNLFHSFDQFSVMPNEAAIFADTDAIKTIITRVTGATQSTLNGLIQADTDVDLFLINPAGIVFGPDAQLDIGGSFLASTGTSLQFENGFVYDALAPQAPPLLTISAPMGLSLGSSEPGSLQVTEANLQVAEGQTLSLVGGDVAISNSQLAAPAGRIEIIGIGEANDLSLGQGLDNVHHPTTTARNIDISGRSVIDTSGSGGGAIALYGQDITLTDRSAIISDTLGTSDGQGIRVIGDRVSLLDSSYIGTATFGSGTSSSIDITANAIEIIGTAIANYKQLEFATFLGTRQLSERQIGGITTRTVASGRAGNISLNTKHLVMDEGVLVSAESFGIGDSGDIAIAATESIRVRGSGITAGSRVSGIPLFTFNSIPTGLSTSDAPAGAGGNVDLTTDQLTLEDGGVIAAITLSDHDSGNVTIHASNSLILEGFFEPFLIPTAISTITIGGKGAAGDILIETDRLIVQDGSAIFADSGSRGVGSNVIFGGQAGNVSIFAAESVDIVGERIIGEGIAASGVRSSTFSDAPAGHLAIRTPTLNVLGGGRISTATFNSGNGGAIDIKARDIILSGAGSNNLSSGILANSGIETQIALTTGQLESVPASGTGGTITITTANLAVQNSSGLTVGSFGSGVAGNLNITADTVDFSNGGRLSAATTSNGGGNITLTADAGILNNSSITATSESSNGGNLFFDFQDVLLLRNGSLISAEAGTAAAAGNGGSITFEGGLIIAVPDENSDIIANAFAGQGGQILLAVHDVLGFETSSGFTTAQLRNNQTNDISASSAFGEPGEIQILDQIIDPDQGLSELPTDPLGGSRLIGQSVCAAGEVSNFVVSGRGGVPLSPQDVLGNDAVWTDERDIWSETLAASTGQFWEPRSGNDIFQESALPLVEAQGVSRLADGTVALVAPEIGATESVSGLTCQTVSEPTHE